MSRAEVPVEQTWDLDALFPSVAAWEAELGSVETAIESVTRFQGRLGECSMLRECLDARERLTGRLWRAGTYASLRNGADGTNTENQANLGRVSTLYAKVDAALSFVDTEILGLPDGTVERFMREDAAVASHKVDLDDLLDIKPHMLGAETEKALASLGEVMESPYRTYSRSKMSDIRFARFTDSSGAVHENSFNLFEWVYESHADPVVRRNAWKSFCDGLKAYNNTYAATLSTEISKQVVLARLRRYPDVEHYLLQPHKVPFELYTNVVNVIQEELA
ncbi:MAG TPA: hypothetical protein VK996_13045, partial [Ramlibacter sp.]|nr:hypothetical protein [Ramlibacter sp.]